MPLGARVAKAFLDLMVVILILPMIYLAPACLMSLSFLVQDQGRSYQATLASASVYLIFEAFLGMSLAAFWMICLLRSRYPGSYPGQMAPSPPLLVIVKPIALTTVLQAILAILMWLGARAFGHEPAWVWVCFWLPTGVAAWFMNRWLNRIPEDEAPAS